jgi:exosome complex exonuclease DIS3/RRP44
MISTNSSYRVSRSMKVMKCPKERYLAEVDDIICDNSFHGSPLSIQASDTLLFDTNTIIESFGLIEKGYVKLGSILILRSSLNTIKTKSRSLYRQILAYMLEPNCCMSIFENMSLSPSYCRPSSNESLDSFDFRAFSRASVVISESLLSKGFKVTIVSNRKGDISLKGLLVDDFYSLLEFDSQNGDFRTNPQKNDAQKVASRSVLPLEKPSMLYKEHFSPDVLENGVLDGKFVKGTLRMTGLDTAEVRVYHGSNSGYVIVKLPSKQSINRAIDGDVVVLSCETPVSVLFESQLTSVVGEVVGIKTRRKTVFCGILVRTPSGSYQFKPVNSKFPCFSVNSATMLSESTFVLATFVRWVSSSSLGEVKLIKEIGKVGDVTAENEVILLEHEVRYGPFTKEVYSCLPPASYVIDPHDIPERVDLRHLDVMSVDPPGCKDIDDALHVSLLSNGDIEVGVHIADVSHFVKPFTPLDEEAALRGNSTYLVSQRMDMLPGILTETLCSLRSNVDRYAFSVMWQFSPEGPDRWKLKPEMTKFCKSIIKSRASLTYQAAQIIIDTGSTSTCVDVGGKPVPSFVGEFASSLRLLLSLSRSLKASRIDAGALTLSSSEVKIVFDPITRAPASVKPYETFETNSMVEEMMLLANVTVAQKIWQAYPRKALLRRHPPPSVEKMNSLKLAAESADILLDTSTSKLLSKSLSESSFRDEPLLDNSLKVLTTRSMSQAVYFSTGDVDSTDFYHYGLAVDFYTHFTSPIRRYADLVVHRFLSAALGFEKLAVIYHEYYAIRRLCDNLNRRHAMSQFAGRESVHQHVVKFVKSSSKALHETAVILDIKAGKIDVLIPRLGLVGVLAHSHLLTENNPSYELIPEKKRLVQIAKGVTFSLRIFQKVTVSVTLVEANKSASLSEELEYSLVEPAVPCLQPSKKRIREE